MPQYSSSTSSQHQERVTSAREARRHLGIDNDMKLTPEEIHRAFVNSAMRYHPDRTNVPGAMPCSVRFEACLQSKDLLLAQQSLLDKLRTEGIHHQHRESSLAHRIVSHGRRQKNWIGVSALILTYSYTEWTRLQQMSRDKKQKKHDDRMFYKNL